MRTKQTARTSGLGVPALRKPVVPKPVSHRQREKEYNLMLKTWLQETEEKKKSPELLSQLAAISKERELIIKVLSIRKEYEETVLPHLPASIQFTGAMVLGSLLPSVTVELRKGQLEDAEKQL